jgi:malate dehydrogenase (quinone)
METVSTDVVLIGAGIMSATLGMLMKELQPSIKITIYERLDEAAAESSDAWNNAGTGHSAFCELNYTPQQKDGSIDIHKAVQIAESFEVSKQFWAYLVEQNIINPEGFIRSIPHMSLVWGDANVSYLRKRYDALKQCHLFKEMEYTDDRNILNHWIPLVMEGRSAEQKIAATKMDVGTDVNFGSLTRGLFKHLQKQEHVTFHCNHEVKGFKKDRNGNWNIKIKNLKNGDIHFVNTKFVFIGAGGGALPLLLKSGIPEGKSFGGFPVSGQWLRCTNREVIEKHHAKVYGKASVGSPPMSVPHLDTRIIKGKKELLFGPYAGLTTKFLKKGSFFDLLSSIHRSNIKPMLSAGVHNIPLTKYLIRQVTQSARERLEALREFVPEAKAEDWELEIAGQRVQVIKKDDEEGGILEFGTEVISSADGSLAALLGASPGASTSVSIMLNVLAKCFPHHINTNEWQSRLEKIIPSYNKSLGKDTDLATKTRERTSTILGLKKTEAVFMD